MPAAAVHVVPPGVPVRTPAVPVARGDDARVLYVGSIFNRRHVPDLVRALVKLYQDNASTLSPDPLHSAFHDSHPPAALRVARLQAAGRLGDRRAHLVEVGGTLNDARPEDEGQRMTAAERDGARRDGPNGRHEFFAALCAMSAACL